MAATWKKIAFEDDVILKSFIAAKGDIIGASANDTPGILSVGSDGKVLTADADAANGLGIDWVTPGAGVGDVTSAAAITEHSLVRGDGGAKGVQDTAIIVDDSDNVSGVAAIVVTGHVHLFDDGGEYIGGDGTDMTLTSSAKINLTAVSDVILPVNVGLILGDGGEKIESNNTDLTVNCGGSINLTATADVVIPANVGITFGTGEKIEGDSTDLTITSGAKIVLAPTTTVDFSSKAMLNVVLDTYVTAAGLPSPAVIGQIAWATDTLHPYVCTIAS